MSLITGQTASFSENIINRVKFYGGKTHIILSVPSHQVLLFCIVKINKPFVSNADIS
jgi:hypothetical protein